MQEGLTVLMRACRLKDLPLVQCLVDAGAELELIDAVSTGYRVPGIASPLTDHQLEIVGCIDGKDCSIACLCSRFI
jgi:hypothetical protein